MKIPVPNGGGSGSGSTECTATAEDILETKTAIYNGSGDEPEYGSMKNVDSIDPAKSITISSGVLYARMTNGAHVQDASSGYPEVSVPQADLASTAGLTAAKIATGNTILGIAGTYTGLGTAGTSQVLSGYTFSSASLSGASGAMSDRSGTTTSATASLDSSNSRVRLQIPNSGYYNTSAYLYTSYSNMASLIGLTANRIVNGYTILGIAGTNYGKGVAEDGALYFFGEDIVAHDEGSYFGYSGSGVTYHNAGDMIIDIAGGARTIWAFSGKTFNLGNYSTLHVRIRQLYGTMDSRVTLTVPYGTSTSSETGNVTADIYPSFTIEEYTVDLSGVSGTYYIGLVIYNRVSTNNGIYLIDHIWLT